MWNVYEIERLSDGEVRKNNIRKPVCWLFSTIPNNILKSYYFSKYFYYLHRFTVSFFQRIFVNTNRRKIENLDKEIIIDNAFSYFG